ncbi:MAG: TonB-dependent receptor [Candidatus Eremiobacteraeota bacterium]|nr:TonB-dependent receptor [Candidatus Eremiobacteraeota bacterium]
MSIQKLRAFVFACFLSVAFALPAAAGTTGGLHGRITDVESGQPVADVSVTVTAPAQTATTVTSASGEYTFLSLNPDTYTLTAKKDGYSIEQVPGITIISDQVRSVNVRIQRSLKTIGKVAVHGTAGLVRSGVVSDVYSVNAVTQKAAAPLAGAASLNQAYGAIATAPGVNYDQGQQGWYQNIFIRGGDIDQVAYEFDGVPVIRESDDGAVTTLTNLGQAEVQVYAGGTPASADAPGLAGYINQVVKTGTYPGYANMAMGIGGPPLYNKAMLEAAGGTPDRLFTYYVGTQYVTQDNRFGDQFNGASNPLYFYPLSYGNPYPNPTSTTIASPLNTVVPDGSAQWLWAPGPTNAIAHMTDQETIANFHIGLSHKHDTGKDDIQLLYDNSLIVQKFYGSVQDQITQNVETAFGGPMTYFDGVAYNGQVGAPPQPGLVAPDLFPNSPQLRAPFAQLPIDEREGSQNGVALAKFQYQRNINSTSYLRFDAYTDYAIWFISGPVSSNLTYGGQLPDYEVNEHKYGGKLDYSNQISEKHLLEATASYLTAHLETYSGQLATFLDYAEPTTNLVDKSGNCYAFATGVRASCFPQFPPAGYPNLISQGCITYCSGLVPGTPPAGTPAALAGAQWIVTEPGPHAQLDTVKPYFSGYSVNDQWRPNDRLTMNLGVRLDLFDYRLDDLSTGYPARQFWFNAYNNEFCFANGLQSPIQRTFDLVTGAESPCPAGTSPTQLTNFSGGTDFQSYWQPRFGATYTVTPDLVLRATAGRYVRPASTSYHEYNVIQQDLPLFISTFINMGFNSPIHPIHADTANNYDFSVEQHLHGTDMSYKLTPFYRTTQGQLQFTSLNAQGVLAAINAGQQTSKGVEFAFTKGNFAADGWTLQLGSTYLNSTIKYGPQPNGQNVIDILNNYIQQFNSFTSACAGAAAGGSQSMCGIYGGIHAHSSYLNTTTGVVTGNPYFRQAPQPLLDRNARYPTYSVIPSPFNNANGFATPFDSTLVVNYKHKNWNVSPTFTFTDGEEYGSPLVWPGYDPSTCGNVSSISTPAPDTTPAGCSGMIFIPDKYTGHFDTLGAFQQPPRLTMSLAFGWQPTDKISTTFTVTSLIDHCWQRGFPWDSATTCIYAQLPSNLLSPGGNFLPNPPIQLAYPYGSWYNNTEIGQEGQKTPTSYSFEMSFKL